MIKLRSSLKRSGFMLAALSLLASFSAMNLSIFASNTASAAQLTSRKLELSSTAPGTVTTGAASSYTNGASATHTFTFRVGTNGMSTKAVVFQYCTNAIGTCTAPVGSVSSMMSLQSATKGTITGTGITDGNWSVASDDLSTLGHTTCSGANGKANCIAVKTATASTFSTGGDYVFPFAAVVNPNEVAAFYVHVYFYDSNTYATGSYGTEQDSGTVASAIVDPITITARVKERLGFSTTTSDASNTAVTAENSPTCDPLVGGGSLTLGDAEGVLDQSTAYKEFSYYRIYTNAVGGVLIKYAGDTLTKGADNIDALTSEVASNPSNEQFGLAVNSSSGITNVDTTFPGTAGTTSIDTGYDEGGAGTPKYNFATASATTPVTIASSSGYVICDTAAVQYLANISPNTPAGTYTTTITYYAVPTF